MRLLRLISASVLGLLIAASAGAGTVLAQEEVVMPFACDARGGGVRLIPAAEQSYRIYGSREQRLFRYCSPETPDRCRNWMLHRFEVDCGGVRVPWIQVAEAGAQRGRAWVENGRMSLQMGAVWASPREERRAWRRWFRKPAYGDDREPFNRPYGSQGDVVELPAGFAPVLGTGAQFIGHASEVSSAPLERSVEMVEIGPGASVEMPVEMPAREPALSPPTKEPVEPVVKTIKPPAPTPAKRETAKSEGTAPETKSAASAEKAAASEVKKDALTPAAKPESPPDKAAAPTGTSVTPTIINKPQGAPAPPEPPSASPSEPEETTVGEKAVENSPSKTAAVEPMSPSRDTVGPQKSAAPQPEATASPIATGSLRDGIEESAASQMRLLTIGFVLFGVIAASSIVLLTRRREHARIGVVRRDIGSVSFDGHASAGTMPVTFAPGALPASAADAADSFASMPVDNGVPTTTEEALRVIGASPDATIEVIKKIVDGLRQSWHPDFARSEEDRSHRETRIKQINVAWDILAGRNAA